MTTITDKIAHIVSMHFNDWWGKGMRLTSYEATAIARKIEAALSALPDAGEGADDTKLGEITEQDREYAAELIADCEEEVDDSQRQLEVVAQWLRKVRHQAVIDDRKNRGEPAPDRNAVIEKNADLWEHASWCIDNRGLWEDFAVSYARDRTHDWFRPKNIDYDCCRRCGIVRRADR